MLFRHLGVTLPKSAATCRVDQRPRLVPRRILEGGAARAAAQWLRFFARSRYCVHLRADRSAVSGRTLERRLDDDRTRRHVAMAITVVELLNWPLDDLP